jgi:hypothetical protein
MGHIWPAIALASLLAACGGGGGGPSPEITAPPASSPAPVAAAAALSFSPALARASFETGTSSTINVTATVNQPADFSAAAAVYAYVIDDSGVILPNARILQNSALQYSAILHTSPSLAAGKYSGNFTIRLCRDIACATQFPGSPMQLPYEFQVAPVQALFSASSNAPLAATAHVGAVAPAAVTVSVKGDGRAWTVASDAAWTKLNSTSGNGAGSFVLSYDTGGLSEGTYSATLTINASDGQRTTLPVSLQLLPNAFRVDSTGISFNAVNGAPIAPQTVSLEFDSGVVSNWTASSDAGWLGINPGTGSTPAQTTLSVNPANGALASGTYTASVTLSSPSAAARKVPVQLKLSKPTLSMSTNSITLGGTYGREFQPQTLTMNLNTLTNAWPWSTSTLPAWIGSTASGTVSQTGSAVVYTPKPAAAPLGTSTSVVTASVKVNGDTLSAPLALTINKDQHKILASETAVALVSTPAWSRLTRTLTVSDNFGQNSAWSAVSNQSWLAVSVSGNQLTLNANPSPLQQNTVSYATVTLSTSASGVVAPEPVRVALWKGDTSPTAMTKLNTSYKWLVADPIRPLLYAHDGGTTIDVYNFYTAQQTASITGLGAALGDMTISPNGDRLYAYDTTNRNVVRVSLSTLSKEGAWPLAAAVGSSSRLKAIRPNGVEIILLSNGGAIAAATGKSLGSSIAGGDMSATADGKTVYLQDEGISPASLLAFSVDYSELGGGTLFTAQTQSGWFVGDASNGADLAVSADGSRLYRASGAPYRCGWIKPSDLSFIGPLPGGDAYPNNVEVGSDGRVYCGISGWYSTADFWVHGADGVLLKSYKIAGYARALLPRQMVVSGDGMIVAVLTDDPLMAIVPVGP